MHKNIQCLAAATLVVVSIPLYAHDSIAAQYVLPDARTEWRVYNPNIQRSVNPELISYKPGWYVGGGVGPSEVSPEGTSGGFYVQDDRDFGFKIFAGRRQFPHWSAELSYAETGEAGIGNINPAIEATFSDATIRYHIPTISGSYHVFGPKNDIDVFARVGLSSIFNTVSDDRIPYEKQTPVQLNLGGGVQWRFDPKWFARVEFDSYDNDASLLAFSIGRYIAPHNKHRPVVLPEIEPPEPAPMPEPQPEPVPEPVTEEVCDRFTGTIDAIQFEIDSDQLKEESKPALVETALALTKYAAISIEIQAHTDATASDEYNLALSIRRAESVRNFLLNEGVDGSRLIAQGYGESQPRATNDTAEGRALNRRVEFKVLDETICQ